MSHVYPLPSKSPVLFYYKLFTLFYLVPKNVPNFEFQNPFTAKYFVGCYSVHYTLLRQVLENCSDFDNVSCYRFDLSGRFYFPSEALLLHVQTGHVS